jgi:hypothetical protein
MKLMIPEITRATAIASRPRIGVMTWMSSQTAARSASLRPV